MSELNPPWALENLATHHANVNRMLMALLNGNAEGVLVTSPNAFAVTQRGAGANMSVDVAAGVSAVFGDENAQQGLYGVVNDATKNVTIAAADPTNPRRDLIVLRVRDAFYSGATNAWDIFAVTGTPAGSPVDPTVPNNSHVLARVAVAAAASSIVNANITDLRAFSPLGILPVNSSRRPGVLYGPYSQEAAAGFRPSVVNGLPIWEQDNYALKFYTTATTGFQKPWNMPWGFLGYAATTASQGSITGSYVDLTSLSVAMTLVANRLIRCTVFTELSSTVANDVLGLAIRDGSNNVLQVVRRAHVAGSDMQDMTATIHTGTAAGALTLKASAIRHSGTGTVTSLATAGPTAFIIVEDVGPNGNPA